MAYLATLFWLAVYWLVFVPVAAVHRRLSRSPLPLAPDPAAPTYWTTRSSGFGRMDRPS